MRRYIVLWLLGLLVGCGAGREAMEQPGGADVLSLGAADAAASGADEAGSDAALPDATAPEDADLPLTLDINEPAEVVESKDVVCVPDCQGKVCGPDGCGGVCGVCYEGCYCSNGNCLGCDETCAAPAVAQKLVVLSISYDAHPGGGLDLDGDPATCAPVDDCSGGVDNQFAANEPVILQILPQEDPLQQALEEGQVFPLLAADAWPMDGTEFEVAALFGDAPVKCDWQTESCAYPVGLDNFDNLSCLPKVLFENARVQGQLLIAGGPDSVFLVSLPIQAGVVFSLPLLMAQLQANVQVTADGTMQLSQGIIGGALPKAKVMQAIDLLPDGLLPIDKETVKQLVDQFLVPDLDADQDGIPESVSMALEFSTIPATILQ